MNKAAFAAMVPLAIATLLFCNVAQADDIKFLGVHALKAATAELAPRFERATGHRLLMQFDVIGRVRQMIAAGEPFDAAILNPRMFEDMIKDGKIAAGSTADIARVGIGVAVRAGAPKPDVSSVEAVKRMLLAAKTVAYPGEGLSGAHFNVILARLGIADAMKPKLKPMPPGKSTDAIASGEADILVVTISTIVADRRVELAGPLPEELQTYLVFSAGVSANAKAPAAAKAWIDFLKAPESAPVIKSKGMQPG